MVPTAAGEIKENIQNEKRKIYGTNTFFETTTLLFPGCGSGPPTRTLGEAENGRSDEPLEQEPTNTYFQQPSDRILMAAPAA